MSQDNLMLKLRKIAAVESEMKRRGMAIPNLTPAPKPQEQTTKPLPDPIDWITHNFYLYDTGNLITLYDCQRRPLELALSRDAAGLFKYTTIQWSWPKKSAKSSVI